MQTVFSQRLLAGLRTLRGEEQVRDDDIFQDPVGSGPKTFGYLEGIRNIRIASRPGRGRANKRAMSRYWRRVKSATIAS
jgi:hypothetical protein